MQNPGTHFISLFQKGSKEVFSGLYNSHYASLYYFAKRFVVDRQDAEDIVAESFIKLWRLRENFDNPQSIKAFLFITTRNGCLDFLRAAQRQGNNMKDFIYTVMQDDTELVYAQDEVKAEVLGKLLAEIEKLPPKCKQIFKMAYFDGMKNEAIAQKLELSYQTVKNQKVRAIKILRVAFNGRELAIVTLLMFVVKSCVAFVSF